MNKRLNELRTTLNLSLEEFGKRLGVTRTAVYLWESGKRSISEQTIKLISKTYNVNENWLRTGNGSMFNEEEQSFFAELQNAYGLDDNSLSIIKAFSKLPELERSSFINTILKIIKD